jgi:pimeloyl-ACP methyl ester carboxylesterase
MRDDLETARATIDPDRRWPPLDEIVLIGHSMGGLVSRLQTLPSGDRYWRILSDRPLEELHADPETRQRVAKTLFFEPNPSIRRVITIGTPHRGSDFSNDYTRWLGQKLIRLPAMIVQTKTKIVRENPGFFRNTEILTTNTSIDSLSPDSPLLPAMLQTPTPPWVKYNNIVGVVSEESWLTRMSDSGDGVVSYESAHLDDAESEVVVDADHVHVHQHPRAILEVRRILLEHSREMYAEMSGASAIPAGYQGLPSSPSADQNVPLDARFWIHDQEPPADARF